MSLRSLFKGKSPAFALPDGRGGAEQGLMAPASSTAAASWGEPEPPDWTSLEVEVGNKETNFNYGPTGLTRKTTTTAIQRMLQVDPVFEATANPAGGTFQVNNVSALHAPGSGVSVVVEGISMPSGGSIPVFVKASATTVVFTYGALPGGETLLTIPAFTMTWYT